MDNVKAFTSMDTIKDEAATWVVRIHGYTRKPACNAELADVAGEETDACKAGAKLPADTRRALRAWMDQSHAHRDCLLKMLNSWDAMGMLEDLAEILPLAEIEAARHKTASPGHANPFRGWRIPAFITAGLTAASAVAFMVLLMMPPQHRYATGIGEQASYTLEDGSAISLNTNSEVAVDYGDDRRVITLTRGEASFTVAKDPQRPFMVYAGKGAVWAVGTVFNVKHSQRAVDVIVSEGTVKVFSRLDRLTNSRPLELEQPIPDQTRAVLVDAGEGVQYEDRILSKEPLSQATLHKRLAWQQGVLIFEGETLAEALEQISRYTDQQLIADASISRTRVGGRFKTDNIDQLLDSLARSLDIHMESREGNKVLFTAKQ